MRTSAGVRLALMSVISVVVEDLSKAGVLEHSFHLIVSSVEDTRSISELDVMANAHKYRILLNESQTSKPKSGLSNCI